jgi:uncharacterized lipoprotein NlpE involved in copper resistance
VFVPFLHYAANKEYYLERCENKAKPELECDGCCQVKKEVYEAEHDQHTNTSTQAGSEQRRAASNANTNSNETSEWFHLTPAALDFTAQLVGIHLYNSSHTSSTLAGFRVIPFQPPRG